MSNIISQHPIFNHANEIKDICKPLEKLSINYFAHVRVDNENNFSVLANNTGFLEHYLRNEYYNADIHLADNSKFGNYVIWDAIERYGQSEKMHREAAQFGVQHTFTIIEKNQNSNDYYHFAHQSSSNSINQVYLSNLDLLKCFILHFNDNVSQTNLLSLPMICLLVLIKMLKAIWQK